MELRWSGRPRGGENGLPPDILETYDPRRAETISSRVTGQGRFEAEPDPCMPTAAQPTSRLPSLVFMTPGT